MLRLKLLTNLIASPCRVIGLAIVTEKAGSPSGTQEVGPGCRERDRDGDGNEVIHTEI